MKTATIESKRVDKLTYCISKKVGMAIADYRMLQDRDRILVGLSGGKDSLTLLEMLRYRQRFVPIDFDIIPVHVDLGFSSDQGNRLQQYCAQHGLDCHIEQRSIVDASAAEDLNCFWCSWNRRKVFFHLAERLGCNKIALGHHFDDIVETILMNLFYHGQVSSMVPRQELFDGALAIIRPLAYVKECETARFARDAVDFPCAPCQCNRTDDSKRAVIKKILSELEKDCPHIKKNIMKSVRRVKADYLP